jgi:hypothetical protein
LKDLSVHDKTATGLTAIDVAEKRLEMEKLVFEKTPTDTEWLTAFRDLLETIRVPTANQSPISPSGKSDISDDIFHDALQHLTFEERSGLAEEGGIQRPVWTYLLFKAHRITHGVHEIWNCKRGRGRFVIFSGYLVGTILDGGVFLAKEIESLLKKLTNIGCCEVIREIQNVRGGYITIHLGLAAAG